MGILDTYASTTAWYNRKLKDSYVGNCVKVLRPSDSAEADIGFDANGDIDMTALNDHLLGEIGEVSVAYLQDGSPNGVPHSTINRPKIGIQEKDGLALITFQQGSQQCLRIDSSADFSNYSLYLSCIHEDFSPSFYTVRTLVGSNSSALGRYNLSLIPFNSDITGLGVRGSVTEGDLIDVQSTINTPVLYTAITPPANTVGNVTLYRDGTLLNETTVFESSSVSGLAIGGSPGLNNGNEVHVEGFVYYQGVNHDASTRQAIENELLQIAQLPSGTITFNDVAFSNGVVDFFSAPYTAQGAITKVEQVAISSGVATMTVERDPLLDYFGIARGMTQDFQGILASAPAGDVISTGLDLTGISIGGANDDHYIFRATDGTGAGTEVTVKSNTGGDITVTDASAFAIGTEFTLGRFVRGISKVFPKD